MAVVLKSVPDFDDFLRERFISQDDPRVPLLKEAWNQAVDSTAELLFDESSPGITIQDLKADL